MKDYLPTVKEVQEVFSPPTQKSHEETYTEYVGGYIEDYVTKKRIKTYTVPPTHHVKQIYELLLLETEAVWLVAVIESGDETDIHVGKWTFSTVRADSEIGKELTASKVGGIISSEKGQFTVTNVGPGQSYIERERIKNIARINNFKAGVADRAHRLHEDAIHIIMLPGLSSYASVLAQEKEVQDYLESISSDINEMERQLQEAVKSEITYLKALRDETKYTLEERRVAQEKTAMVERQKQEQEQIEPQKQIQKADAERERQRTQQTTSIPSTGNGGCVLTGLYLSIALFAVAKLGILFLQTVLFCISH